MPSNTTDGSLCQPTDDRAAVAIISGAAFGIGRATARRLSTAGLHVVLVDLLDDVHAVSDELGDSATAVVADITNDDQMEELLQRVTADLGDVAVLVNNAGGALFPGRPFWEMSPDDWRRVLDVNLTSQWRLSTAVLPSMRARGAGSIVNVASVTGQHASPGYCAYAASKAGVISLTQTMSRELGPLGIRVNAVAPGYIHFTHAKPVMTTEQVRAFEERVVTSQSLARVGQPDDVAAAIAYLSSDDALHVTGHVLVVDGGH